MKLTTLAIQVLVIAVLMVVPATVNARTSDSKNTVANTDESLIITLTDRGRKLDIVWQTDDDTNERYVDTISASLVNNLDLQTISHFSRLRSLTCVGNFSKVGVEHLSELTNLEQLQLNSGRLSNSSIAVLAEIQTLQRLDIRCISVTRGIDLEPLVNLKKLLELKLPSSEFIGDAEIETISGLEKLVSFHATDSSISDAGLAHLLKFKKLIALNVAGNPVSSEGVSRLAQLNALKYLNLDGIRVNEQVVRLLTNDFKNQLLVVPYAMGKRNGG